MANLLLSVQLVKDTRSFTRSLYIEDVYCLCEKVFKIKPLTELAVCQKGERSPLLCFWCQECRDLE